MNIKKALKRFCSFFVNESGNGSKSGSLERKIKLNALSARLSAEIRKQEGFAKDYLSQAVEAKRTGDDAAMVHLKRLIGTTSAIRRRAERMLHVTRIAATRMEQVECYKEFCEMFAATSAELKNDISPETVVQTQENLQKSIAIWNANDSMIDQLLGAFDSTLDEGYSDSSPSDPRKEAAIDAAISDLAAKKDSSVETKMKDLLQRL